MNLVSAYRTSRIKRLARAWAKLVTTHHHEGVEVQLSSARDLVENVGEMSAFVGQQTGMIEKLQREKVSRDRALGDALENSDKLEKEKIAVGEELAAVKKELAAAKRKAAVLGFQVKKFLELQGSKS
ncbi:hypothetical protein TeGR_g11903 [Tetraparma gracilis]|jgi:hypothetical protein|uniref:Uncharacterized protein n=1 Tax=Tetraparma gracilis TaxID=2962635 RepID=A0ABQ6N3P9_9STRA|nr:hypothetical protein TeGR_g11903 [Tetraparma gracilis]